MNDRRARVLGLIERQPASPDADAGLASYLHRLCAAAVGALTASGAGLSVMVEDGVQGLTAASGPDAAHLEDLQFVLGEGPCIDGVRAAFAFPLQIGSGRLGVLEIFRARPGSLTTEELSQALTFAEVALTTLLGGQDLPASAGTGLDEAMDSRAELFQAQGMVMVQIGGTPAEALARMRAHAYAEDRPLADVAADLTGRRLRFERDCA